jgi:hypothetical protein
MYGLIRSNICNFFVEIASGTRSILFTFLSWVAIAKHLSLGAPLYRFFAGAQNDKIYLPKHLRNPIMQGPNHVGVGIIVVNFAGGGYADDACKAIKGF